MRNALDQPPAPTFDAHSAPLPADGGESATLQLTVLGDTVTVRGLLVAETVDLVLGAVTLLGARGCADVVVDVAGVQAVDAAAAADLAAAQNRLPPAGTRLRIRVPYPQTEAMFPGCTVDPPARPELSAKQIDEMDPGS
jgi:anti-anti-sigma regulatory factor